MQFREHADVFTSDGEKIGRLDRVVIDPRSYEMTHIVTQKGLLFNREKVIPVESIETAGERVTYRL